MTMSNLAILLALAFTSIATLNAPANACDDLVDKLIARNAQAALQNIDCGILGKAGLDKVDARLTRVCYSSTGPTSRIEADLTVTCKTSDKAVVQNSITGSATATAEVRGADCAITFVDFVPSGDLAKALAGILDAKGHIAASLRKALAGAC